MKALKSERARQLVSVNWEAMTAKACDGTEYKMIVVSGTHRSKEDIERVKKMMENVK